MKKLVFLALSGILTLGLLALTPSKTEAYKCMIQMKNYQGEGAYVIVSLVDAQGAYLETLYILGDDPEWYHEISEWWGYFGRAKREVDGITGATLAGGERNVVLLNIDAEKIGKGYSLRFESSVEDQQYHVKDLELPLTQENLNGKTEGTGYIRYVRLMPQ